MSKEVDRFKEWLDSTEGKDMVKRQIDEENQRVQACKDFFESDEFNETISNIKKDLEKNDLVSGATLGYDKERKYNTEHKSFQKTFESIIETQLEYEPEDGDLDCVAVYYYDNLRFSIFYSMGGDYVVERCDVISKEYVKHLRIGMMEIELSTNNPNRLTIKVNGTMFRYGST